MWKSGRKEDHQKCGLVELDEIYSSWHFWSQSGDLLWYFFFGENQNAVHMCILHMLQAALWRFSTSLQFSPDTCWTSVGSQHSTQCIDMEYTYLLFPTCNMPQTCQWNYSEAGLKPFHFVCCTHKPRTSKHLVEYMSTSQYKIAQFCGMFIPLNVKTNYFAVLCFHNWCSSAMDHLFQSTLLACVSSERQCLLAQFYLTNP